MQYLEDLYPGKEFDLGQYQLNEQEMIDFSQQYDPQSFHLDKAVGEQMFGGVIASGIHSMAIFQRLIVDNFLSEVACMASPGIDDVRFLHPVYGDDLLSGKISVVSVRPSKSKPDKGIVKISSALSNRDGKMVLAMMANIFVKSKEN